MARFRCKSCPGRPGEGGSAGAVDVQAAGRAPPQASVGQKTRSAGREPIARQEDPRHGHARSRAGACTSPTRSAGLAEQKLAPLGRIEPRATRPRCRGDQRAPPDRSDGLKRVEASLRIPRKTFRAHAEADDVPTAIDRVRDKLERQLRDHHGKKRTAADARVALGYAQADADGPETDEAGIGGSGRSPG